MFLFVGGLHEGAAGIVDVADDAVQFADVFVGIFADVGDGGASEAQGRVVVGGIRCRQDVEEAGRDGQFPFPALLI